MTARGASWVAVALAALGCGSALPSEGGGSGGGAAEVSLHGIAVTLSDFMIMPDSIQAKAGTVAFAVKNVAQTPHNFSIRTEQGEHLAQTPDLPPGSAAELEISLPAGAYVTFCSLAGHESLGMKGELTVTP